MKYSIKFFLRYKIIILLIVLGLIPLTWFKSDFINGGDFSFPMANTKNVLNNYAHIWLDKVGLGFANSRAIPQLTFFSLFTLANNIGISPQACERILFVLLFSLSGIGMYLLVNLLPIENNKKLVSLIASLFYMFNTFNIIFYWHVLDGMIFFYTVIVLSLVLYLKWYKEKKIIFLILFNIVSVFGGYTFSNPLIIPIFWWTMLLFSFLLFRISDSNKENFSYFVKFSIINIVLWILINSWWFLPLLKSIKEEYTGLSATIGTPVDTLRAFSQNSSFLNLFRLMNVYWAFSDNLMGNLYYTYAPVYFTPLFKIISFLIPIIMFLPLFSKKKSKIYLIISVLTLIYLFLAKGSKFPFGKTFYNLLYQLPFMNAFRAPIHKLGVLICINYAIMFGFGISFLYSLLYEKSKYLAYSIITVLGIILFVIYPYPLWTGEVIHRGGTKYPSYHTKVPEYYNEAEKWISKDKDDFRIASIPVSPTLNTVYKWENGYIGTNPSFNLFSKPGIFTTVDPIAQLPYTILRDTMSNNVWKILRLLNIKYVLLHKDTHEELFDIFTGKYKKISYLEDRLKTQNEIKLEKSFGNIDFYKLSDKYFLPHIYATTDIIPVIGKAKSLKLLIDTEDFNSSSTFIFSDGNDEINFYELINSNMAHKLLFFGTVPISSEEKMGLSLFKNKNLDYNYIFKDTINSDRILLNDNSLKSLSDSNSKKLEFYVQKDDLYTIDVKLAQKYVFDLDNKCITNMCWSPFDINKIPEQETLSKEVAAKGRSAKTNLDTTPCKYKINWDLTKGGNFLTKIKDKINLFPEENTDFRLIKNFDDIDMAGNKYLTINYMFDNLAIPDIEVYAWVKTSKKSIKQTIIKCNNLLPVPGYNGKIFFTNIYDEAQKKLGNNSYYLSKIDIAIKKPETKSTEFTIYNFDLSKEILILQDNIALPQQNICNPNFIYYDNKYIDLDENYDDQANNSRNYTDLENTKYISNTKIESYMDLTTQQILNLHLRSYSSSILSENNKINVKFNLDFDNDINIDGNFKLELQLIKDGNTFYLPQLNLYKEAKKIFPGKKYYNLISIDILDSKNKKLISNYISILNLQKFVKSQVNKPFPENIIIKIANKTLHGKLEKDESGNSIFRTNPLKLNQGNHSLDISTDKKFTIDMVSINPCKIKNNSSNNTDISFKKINPSKYEVNINAKKPFILVFSESFHPNWRASIDDKKIESHFVVNGYANGFLIEKTGNFKITIEYTSQNWFYAGTIISCITFLLLTGYGLARKNE